MDDKLSIRTIEPDKDASTIDEWWESYHKIKIDKKLLPNNGKNGLVAEINGKLIAAVFIYQTNSPVWYCDYLVADPNYKEKNRETILILLIDKAVNTCWELGAEAVWCTTPYDSVLEKLKLLDYTIGSKKHSIIYKNKPK
tara:strand:+ start:1654 stop:2073 length:420 start_codon:yes stop_codon:yes gene_type:complete